MKHKLKLFLVVAACSLLLVSTANAQSTATASTNLTVAIGAEAALTADASTALTNDNMFGNFGGVTNLTYKIRTKSTGSGSLTVKVAEFSPTGGPSLSAPIDPADKLSLTPAVAGGFGTPGAAVPTVAKDTSYPVVSLTGGQKSPRVGAGASVTWTLADNPQYAPASYTAVVTFTLSAS